MLSRAESDRTGWTVANAIAVGVMLGVTGCAGEPAPAEAPEIPAEAAVTETRPIEVAATVAFTEGPTVDADGSVYFTDIGNNRIMRMAPDGGLSTFRQPGNRANGLIFDEQWRLVACEGGDGSTADPRITRTTVETGEVEVLADRYEGKLFHRPNDLTIDGSGRIYFTDRPEPDHGPERTGVHGVYRIDPDGAIERILTEPEVVRPNGIVISPDDTTLYVLETEQSEGGPRSILAFDLAADGTAGNKRVFHDFYPGRSGDGMTIDTEGNLYVAAGLNRLRGTTETLDNPAGVYVLAPDAELIEFIPIPEDTITNAAFGGPDMRTLYVTAGKTLFRIRTDVAGTRR